jgi:hypothetical protein
MLQQFDFLYLCSGKAHERQATPYLLPVIIVFVSFVSTLNTKFWPRPRLDCFQILSFFTLSLSHQFLDACMEH